MSARAAALAGPSRPGPARGERAERALWVAVGIGLAVVLAAAVLRVQANPILAAVVLPLALVAYQRTLLAWQTLLGVILLVILFIPIRRYTVGGGRADRARAVPHPHRGRARCWLFAVCADPAVRWRADGPRGARSSRCSLAILGLARVQPRAVNEISELVLKQVTFFGSYFLVMYFVVERRRPRRAARPHAQAARRRRRHGGASCALRVADRHEPLQRPRPRDAVPALRGHRRAHRAAPARARSLPRSTRSRSARRS